MITELFRVLVVSTNITKVVSTHKGKEVYIHVNNPLSQIKVDFCAHFPCHAPYYLESDDGILCISIKK